MEKLPLHLYACVKSVLTSSHFKEAMSQRSDLKPAVEVEFYEYLPNKKNISDGLKQIT